MNRITVLGGTGYAGGNIVREARARGHVVTSFTRREPDTRLDGVTYRTGSVLDTAAVADSVAGADIVVVALAPSGVLEETFPQTVLDVADLTQAEGARLGVVGSSGTLLAAPGGPKIYQTPDFPGRYAGHSRLHDELLSSLRENRTALEWFVLAPALEFGAYAPGAATGAFRRGGDVLLTDEEGRSQISGADYATAFVDEIEIPAHSRARFTVAY